MTKEAKETTAKPKKVKKVPSGPKWYSADDVKPKPSPRKHNPQKLRSSITPGTVLILLSGRFRGKRVVFLKQLPSGTLLVTEYVPARWVVTSLGLNKNFEIDVAPSPNRTLPDQEKQPKVYLHHGPFEINGVPLRRVNQAYVIATSTRIDVSAVTIPVKNDSYFARVERPKKTVEDQFFDQASKGPMVSDARKADQKTVDQGVIAAIASCAPLLKSYLKAQFTLRHGDRPHEMMF